jgi:hypothetical protein
MNEKYYLPEATEEQKDKAQTRLKIVCCYCKKVMKEGEGAISHGICPTCYREEVKKFEL